MVAEKEDFLLIKVEGLLPFFGAKVVLGQSAQDKLISGRRKPSGNPMARATDVLPNIKGGVYQWMRFDLVHFGISKTDIPTHLAENRGMANAQLVIHDELLPNLSDRLAHNFRIRAAAHPSRPQHGTEK